MIHELALGVTDRNSGALDGQERRQAAGDSHRLQEPPLSRRRTGKTGRCRQITELSAGYSGRRRSWLTTSDDSSDLQDVVAKPKNDSRRSSPATAFNNHTAPTAAELELSTSEWSGPRTGEHVAVLDSGTGQRQRPVVSVDGPRQNLATTILFQDIRHGKIFESRHYGPTD